MDKDEQDNDWSLKWLILLTKLQVVLWTETAGRQCCPSTNPHRKWNMHLPFISSYSVIITIAIMTNVTITCVRWEQLQTGGVVCAVKQAILLSGAVQHANKSVNISVGGQTILGWGPHLSRPLPFWDLWTVYTHLIKMLFSFNKERKRRAIAIMLPSSYTASPFQHKG